MEKIYASPEFYKNKIMEAVQFSLGGDIQGIGKAVFSFFSGEEYINGQQVTVDSYHFEAIFNLNVLNSWCKRYPSIVLKWVEAIFHYFRGMSAIPEIARSIWPWAAKIVEVYRCYELEAIYASCQLASWDYFYGREHYPQYLQHIKALHLRGESAKLCRALLNTTAINREQPDYLENVKYVYQNRKGLSGKNLAMAIIHYYCHVDCRDSLLEELKAFLLGLQMRESVLLGDCDFLKPLIGCFYDNNDYRSMLFFLRKLKGVNSSELLQVAHGFLLSNGKKLSVLSGSGRDEFDHSGSYESYKELIRISNRSTNTAISLLGEYGEDASYFDEGRRGAPPVDDSLEALADATVDHFRLKDPLYNELHSITLVPSHGFPIQSALFRLGRSAPIISTSLEDIVDDPEVRRFVFFLSSHTSTCNIERDFIVDEFGSDQEIIIDPTPEIFLQKLSSDQYNVVYISAHGEYDHWDAGGEEIFFSEGARINVKVLKACIPFTGSKRNVILNICDGATTAISCNPYSRGIAAIMARGNQTVISHLWPVSSVYACAFGVLTLHFIKSNTAMESSRLVFEALNQDMESLVPALGKLSPSFSALEGYLSGKNFEMKEFKNIGSVAVYS